MATGLLPAATFVVKFGCSYCTGKKARQNNNFAQLYPGLAAKWDTKRTHTAHR